MEETAVRIPAGDTVLDGDLYIPPAARGLVVFVHGSGSGRASPRNRFIAAVLERRLATLQFDLTAYGEGDLRFDIVRLARRLRDVTDWVASHPRARNLRIGYFAASTGAAAALTAAATRPDVIAAVVSRGGRPDLAAEALPRVYAPTLLIVGADDRDALPLNQSALGHLAGIRELAVVPGAGHLFEEPGALGRVAELARDWFQMYLGPIEERPSAA